MGRKYPYPYDAPPLLQQQVGSGEGEDSIDMSSKWLGKSTEGPLRDHLVHHSGNGTFAIRVGRWKLILGKGSGGFTRYKPPADAPPGQLFDLIADPAEKRNLYAAKPDVVERLGERLKRIRAAGTSR